jgi:hypothetical protein
MIFVCVLITCLGSARIVEPFPLLIKTAHDKANAPLSVSRLQLFTSTGDLGLQKPIWSLGISNPSASLGNSVPVRIAANGSAQAYVPDLSLIRPYNRELQSLAPYRTPYYGYFHKDSKELYYIAAGHQPGPDNDTFKAIREIIQKAKPQIIVIEGLAAERGLSPDFYKIIAQQKEKEDFKTSVEPEYAAYQAIQADIPFIGAEPSDKTVFDQLRQKNYSDNDVVAFYTLRNIHYWVDLDKINEQSFDQKAQFYLDNLRYYHENNIPAENRLTVQGLKDWFAKHSPIKGKSILSVNTDDVAPISSPDATYIQKLSASVDEVRERNIDTEFANVLSNYDRVLVVYGSAHLLKSRKVIEKMLGPGKDFLP